MGGQDVGGVMVEEAIGTAMEGVITKLIPSSMQLRKENAFLLMVPIREQFTEAPSLKVERDAALDEVRKLRLESDKMKGTIDSLQKTEQKLKLVLCKTRRQLASKNRELDAQKSLQQVKGELKKLTNELSFLQQAKVEIKKLRGELSLVRKQEVKNKKKMEEEHEISLKQARDASKKVRKLFRLVEGKKASLADQLASAQEEMNKLQLVHGKCELILSEEKDKRMCEICMQVPRDSFCLPCLHFRYCFTCLEKHRQTSRKCPFCRVILNGVIKSEISMFND